jgi:hypothetical protein
LRFPDAGPCSAQVLRQTVHRLSRAHCPRGARDALGEDALPLGGRQIKVARFHRDSFRRRDSRGKRRRGKKGKGDKGTLGNHEQFLRHRAARPSSGDPPALPARPCALLRGFEIGLIVSGSRQPDRIRYRWAIPESACRARSALAATRP